MATSMFNCRLSNRHTSFVVSGLPVSGFLLHCVEQHNERSVFSAAMPLCLAHGGGDSCSVRKSFESQAPWLCRELTETRLLRVRARGQPRETPAMPSPAMPSPAMPTGQIP